MDTLNSANSRTREKRISRTEIVYAALREDVIRARLEPGNLLIESELAERFQMSKTPVREALQNLVSEGLIDVIPRKGYVVRQLGARDVRDVLDVRIALESAMAAAAARHATDTDIADLREILDIQKSSTDTETLTNAARRFHEKILDAARNNRAKSILLPLYDATTRIHHLVPLTARYLHSDEETRGHELLLDAISAHDPLAAERIMREHIGAVRETTMHGLLDG